MAGFTHLPLAVVLRIQSKELRMQRFAEMFVFLSVTFDASRFADVLRLRCLRGFRGWLLGKLHRCRLRPAHHQGRDAYYPDRSPLSRRKPGRPHPRSLPLPRCLASFVLRLPLSLSGCAAYERVCRSSTADTLGTL